MRPHNIGSSTSYSKKMDLMVIIKRKTRSNNKVKFVRNSAFAGVQFIMLISKRATNGLFTVSSHENM